MLEEFFENEKKEIDEKLEQYFSNMLTNEKDLLFNDFVSQFKDFVLNPNAKRIHPILFIAAFMGVVNPAYMQDQIEQVREVALSVEFLHNAHLIHDDLIDQDETRRGKPTFHVQLKEELSKTFTNQFSSSQTDLTTTYGETMSILGGSLGYLLGLDIIKNSKFSENIKLMAINEFSQAIDYLMKGMILEEYMYYHNITMSLEQYLNIAELQRARLFEKSAKIGAILAKGNLYYQINPLSEALLKMGQAHAIRDDLIDVFEDIKNKKKKIVYILALQNTNEEQSKTLKEIYNKEELKEEDVKTVELIFADTNALVVAEHFSKNLIEQAKQNLKEIYPDLNKKQKIFFRDFSDFVFLRDF